MKMLPYSNFTAEEIDGYIRSVKPEQVKRSLSQAEHKFTDFLHFISPAAADLLPEMTEVSARIKRRHFGNTVRTFAPLYISSYCMNNCVYCGFRKSYDYPRRRLSFDEVLNEARIIRDMGHESLLLITGPNMSGKSTYMRQTALIVLMAQAGCFVPCERARIGVCDRIFTRIGASDNLAQGQSTFFVEMSELSYILNTATSRSLVILDEIGRGTSTYDGLSIAWAAAEYLCGSGRKIRTLFATHYHEMTALEGTLPGAKNLNVDVAEENGNVVFLHKIVEGSASRSYGIHVAKLAGAPKELLERAQERLADLENGSTADAVVLRAQRAAGALQEQETGEHGDLSAKKGMQDSDGAGTKSSAKGADSEASEQLSFFDLAPSAITQRLRDLDLMNTTPSQALQILEELKEYL